MIIVKLKGGLGNQMFQYAIGQALVYRNKASVKLDISGYDNQADITPRQYKLFLFNTKESFSTSQENKKTKGLKSYQIFKKIVNKLHLKFNGFGYIIERSFNFDSTILNLKDDVYLDGYWQSWKYFSHYSDVIKKDLTLKLKYLNTIDGNLLTQIENSNSVAIHVRRGDYVSSEDVNKFHGICDKSYYDYAIELIKNKVVNPKFFIFSDDPDWCLKEFGNEFFIISGNHDWQDFWLMAKCKHQIIANSSFSWWAAWLNSNIEKIVIAPKKWFSGMDIDINDRLPESWIKL